MVAPNLRRLLGRWRPLLLIGCLAAPSRAEGPSSFDPSDESRFPPALKRAFEARSPAYLTTGRIEWALTDARDPGGHTFYFSWRAADTDILSRRLGDEAGRTNHNLHDGTPELSTEYGGPRSVLVKDGLEWSHADLAPLANVRPAGDIDAAFATDMRLLGLNPTDMLAPYAQNLRQNPKLRRRYSAMREGEIDVVSAENPDTGAVIRWFIDSNKDFGVVKTQTLRGPEIVTETRFDLEQIDGFWFPRRAQRFAGGDWSKASRTVEIISAEFNRPDHPQFLTPNDIGLEPGVNVIAEGGCLPVRHGFWDGEKVADRVEFWHRLHSGEVRHGPTVQRELHRLAAKQRIREQGPAIRAAASQAVAQRFGALHQSQREFFTSQFIKEHALTAEQATAARRILADCQQRAQRHLDTHREEVLAVQESPGSSGIVLNGGLFEVKQEVPEADRVRAERLFAPLNAIFREQLKPRLEALLTRAQRAKAEEAGSRRASDLPRTSQPWHTTTRPVIGLLTVDRPSRPCSAPTTQVVVGGRCGGVARDFLSKPRKI